MGVQKEDMTYDGTTVDWYGQGKFKASSGLPGHQTATEQGVKDAGPIPEGLYSFPLIIAKDATMVAPGEIDTREGIEHLPDTWTYQGKTYQNNAWGPDRVRLRIETIFDQKNRGRDGFYLHDSTKGFSHGCVETDGNFFQRLRDYVALPLKTRGPKARLYVLVKYPAADATTYGGTKVTP